MPNPAYGTEKNSPSIPSVAGFEDLFDELADTLEKENTLWFSTKSLIGNLWRRIIWIIDFRMRRHKKVLSKLNDLRDQLNSEKEELTKFPSSLRLGADGKAKVDNSIDGIKSEYNKRVVKACIRHLEIQINVLEWILRMKSSIDPYPSEIDKIDLPNFG